MSEKIPGKRSVGATHDTLRIINHYLILYRGNEYTRSETAKKILASIENLDGLTSLSDNEVPNCPGGEK